MEKNVNKTGFDFYRIKTEWVREEENGNLQRTKTEELVYASNYTEAEKVAYQIAESENRSRFGSFMIEIIKTKIDTIIYNDIFVTDENAIDDLSCSYFTENEDSGEGLYSVKIVSLEIDPKSGKTKRQTETVYIPASSNADAARKASEWMEDSMTEYVIRDTKFDKAEAIYWPKNAYNRE